MTGRCFLICTLILLTVVSFGQEVTINVPLSQARLLEVDAGQDIQMAGQDSVMLGEGILVVGGSPDFTYQWKDQPGNSNDGRFVFVSSPGTYFITITDTRNCTALDSLEVLDAVSARDLSKGSSHLYPNPSTGSISIPVVNPGSPVRLMIISTGGIIVYEKTHHPADGDKYIVMNLENLHGGLYFIRVSDRYSSRIFSFVKK